MHAGHAATHPTHRIARQAIESRQDVVVLQPTDFRDRDDVVWRLVWAAWRRLWKEDEITFVDAVQASSWVKSTMGAYCTHYRKLALWVGYTSVDGLETEACRYLFQLWGARIGRNGMATGIRYRRVWRCRKWAKSLAVARPYAGLEELRNFARACDSTVDGIWDGGPIIHVPTTGGRGSPHQAWRVPRKGPGVSHR